MAGITDLLTKMQAIDNPKDMEYLINLIMNNPRAAPIDKSEDLTTVPMVPISNADLNRYIQADQQFKGTNLGQNPAAYINPANTTHFTQTNIPSDTVEGNVVNGEYYPGVTPRKLWVNADSMPEDVTNVAVHENIHANTHERPNYYPDMAKSPERISDEAHARLLGRILSPGGNLRVGLHEGRVGEFLDRVQGHIPHSPYLHDEIINAVNAKMPLSNDIGYGPTEPAAWAGAAESLLPSGQMPIQEEMNRKGLGALYAEMTTTGPVATRREPSLLERAQDFFRGESDNGEPYELEGNAKQGKKNGGLIAAVAAHNQRRRARRRS